MKTLQQIQADVRRTYAALSRAEAEDAPEYVFNALMQEHLQACEEQEDYTIARMGAV